MSSGISDILIILMSKILPGFFHCFFLVNHHSLVGKYLLAVDMNFMITVEPITIWLLVHVLYQ